MTSDADDKQRDYYARTANAYHGAHVHVGDEHYIALEYAAGLMSMHGCTSVLDVGAGTGRAVAFLSSKLPGLVAQGVEPSAALRVQAQQVGLDVRDGSGECLPFDNESVDAVISTGVMHHVPEPHLLVGEMTRVARRIVLISDSNRFGQGSAGSQLAKVMLYKARAWSTFERLRTHGKGFMESEADGIFYSYSVHDSRKQLADWADRVFTIPTTVARHGFFGSLTESTHALIVAVREPGDRWAGILET